MADFTTSYIGGPEGSPVTPLSPVETRFIGNPIGDIAASTAGVAGNIMARNYEVAKEQQLAELKAQGDRTVAEFINKQLAITQAVETGQIKNSAEARMRMRQNLTRYVADNPSLATDIGKAHNAFIKTSGLGEAVYEGTEEEKMAIAIEQDAVKAGWITPNMTDQERQSGAIAYTQFKRAQELLGYEQKQISLQSAKVGLATAQINQQSAAYTLQEKRNKQASQVALGQMASAYSTNVVNKLEDIRKRVDNGELDAQQGTMLMDQALFEVEQVARQAGSQAGTDYVNNLVAPMRLQVENYKGYLLGTVNKTALENKAAITTALQVNNALGDPEVARIAALSKILPNASIVTQIEAGSAAYRFLQGNMSTETKPADILPDYEKDKQGVDEYFQILKQGAGAVLDGSATDIEGTSQEIDNNLTNILNGIDVYGATTSKPSDFNAVVKFLADPKVGKYITQRGGMQPQAAIKAKQSLEFYYMNEVLPVVQSEYQKALTGGQLNLTTVGRTSVPKITGQEAVSKQIRPVFTGAGVSFVAAPDASPYTKQKAKDLNKNVAPIVNNLTYMSAHLEGTTDYKSYYETYFAPLFEDKDENTEQGNNQAE